MLVFSGFVADHPSVHITADTTAGTPIWWGHGTADTAIPYPYAEAGWAALRAAGANLEAHAWPGVGHTISTAAVVSGKAFVAGK